MKRLVVTAAILALFSCGSALAKTPLEVAGFILGEDIEKYAQYYIKETKVPLNEEPFLTEFTLKPYFRKHFRTGYLICGNCANPGRLVRIKLKFVNNDKKFYERLLETAKELYGKPSEWRGDPFHNVLAWKWSIKDEKGRKVSLVLTHSRDADNKPGNSLKITLRSAWDAEEKCYQKKTGYRPGAKHKKRSSGPLTEKEYESLLPH